MRVTSKAKRIKSKGAIKHLVFDSDTHRQDRQAADRLRTSVQIELPVWKRTEIAFSSDLAMQSICKGGMWESCAATEFEEFNMGLVNQRSWYRDKNGKKRQTKTPLITTYAAIPPWWSRAIQVAVTSGNLTVEEAKAVIAEVGMAGMNELVSRTGYEAVHFAIHPESEANLHFHYCLCAVNADHKLVGKSANGQVGKKGLRNAGDVNGNLESFSRHIPEGANGQCLEVIKMGMRKCAENDFDDIAVRHIIEKKLSEFLPDLTPLAGKFGKEHVGKWIVDRESKKQISPENVASLRAAIDWSSEEAARQGSEKELLKAELSTVRSENEKLKTSTIGALEESNKMLKSNLAAVKFEHQQLQTENVQLKTENQSLKQETDQLKPRPAPKAGGSVQVPDALRKQIESFCGISSKVATLDHELDDENEQPY